MNLAPFRYNIWREQLLVAGRTQQEVMSKRTLYASTLIHTLSCNTPLCPNRENTAARRSVTDRARPRLIGMGSAEPGCADPPTLYWVARHTRCYRVAFFVAGGERVSISPRRPTDKSELRGRAGHYTMGSQRAPVGLSIAPMFVGGLVVRVDREDSARRRASAWTSWAAASWPRTEECDRARKSRVDLGRANVTA